MSSGVWAAMRDRRLLSARGHPDRLRKRRKSEGQAREKGEKGGKESECERIERRERKDMSEGKSRMRGIPRSFRKKRTDGKR